MNITKKINSQYQYSNYLANHSLIDNESQENISVRLSFQLMTCAEPAQMVVETIKSLLAIKSEGDEILIIDNNHTETALYEPVAKYCAKLDISLKVRFYHIDAIAGFKSGALNLALKLMNPSCTHVVVVDSDYKALSHARASIAAAIDRYPTHALLQFPQFYRDRGLIDVHSELNHYFNHHLYRPFNRKRALSTGTYSVIRRDALLSLGGWSSASITEDAQMGVLMHRRGLHGQFIPEVIATGLLPTTLSDLISQRQRWIYGNMQVLSRRENFKQSVLPANSLRLDERFRYIWAHFSQLSAWVNFTGVFIVLQCITLLIIAGTLVIEANTDTQTLLMPLYAVYVSYALFISRRLWAYCRDRVPLTRQVNSSYVPSLKRQLRAWALHLNFWELGALSWWPVLWGRDKPFICTPKQKSIQTRGSIFIANLIVLPKLLLMLNTITAILVAPFSPFYSPLLFVCAVAICLLKLWAAHVIFANYTHIAPSVSLSIVKS